MLSWKNIFKSWVGVPVLILVAFTAVLLLPGYKSWQLRRAYDKVEEPYYTDTYGGATPEETYDLFIDALKDGDVELASKYFVLESQDNWFKALNELKNNKTLPNYLEEIINNRTNSRIENQDEEGATFFYKYSRTEPKIIELPTSDNKTQKINLSSGTFEGQVTFVKYPKVWKIELL